MAPGYDEDLFESSKMTFGEHLEELRSALIKALLSLLLGFLVGLLFGRQIVRVIEGPITDALARYYAKEAAPNYVQMLKGKFERGESVPSAFADFEQMSESDRITAAQGELLDQKMIPDLVYVDPAQIVGQFKQRDPERFQELESVPKGADADSQELAPTSDRSRLVPIYVWRSVENDARTRLKTLAAEEGFMVYIKASLMLGFVLASPLIFFFIWQFIAAGLYPHEKRFVYVFMPFSLVLFLAGAALAFFVVFRYVLDFLFWFNATMGIDPDPRINEWMSFAMMLPLGFGISFQLPLVMLFLERIGIFTVSSYLAKWRMAILVICVLSMLLTPSDPQSMILMAVPLIALYFGGVLLCRFMPRRKTPFE